MVYKMSNPDAPATRKQLWALFCITKRDWRDMGLTKKRASEIISKHNKNAGYTVKNTNTWAAHILKAAEIEGMNALRAAEPTPMVVAGGDRRYMVPDGVCGFAWVVVKAVGKGRSFINALKKVHLATSDRNARHPKGGSYAFRPHYRGGFAYWVHQGDQSMERKIAFSHAFAEKLRANGIECHTGSRMD